MKRIQLTTAQGSYPILIGRGLLSSVGKCAGEQGVIRSRSKVLIVTNQRVAKLYLGTVKKSLRKVTPSVSHYVLEHGNEQDKSVEGLEDIWNEMLRIGLERSSVVVALGGGVVGDLAGFAASTYVRGVSLIHLPTTLLAQVDSSIGGKTAIDLKAAKNAVGAFYQPKLVLSDVETLKSFDQPGIAESFAEVIKYGVIQDAQLFQLLERRLPAFLKSWSRNKVFSFLEEVIYRSVRVKAKVVREDVFETKGKRIVLNYGHTLAHALESELHYRTPHSEAVAAGMVFAARMARRFGMLGEEDEKRQFELIKSTGLPTGLAEKKLSCVSLIQFMKRDKKVLNGKLRFVLPTRIGEVKAKEVTEADVTQTFQDLGWDKKG